MLEEFVKIRKYLIEGQKLWEKDPELVLSLRFFELWEEVHRPRPFSITEDRIMIGDVTVSPLKDKCMIGCFIWDLEEECPCLFIEGERTKQKFFLMFEDGSADFRDAPVIFADDLEISYGERLEVIYEILSRINKKNPRIDPKRISRAEYLELLEDVKSNHGYHTIRVMKKLSLRSVNKLVDKAFQDMAQDEIGNQLVLPLEGNFAIPSIFDQDEIQYAKKDPSSARMWVSLKKRTHWTIRYEMELMLLALDFLLELEEIFVLPLSSHYVIKKESENTCFLRIPIEEKAPVLEGDRLNLFVKGENRPLGSLYIELLEPGHLMGKLSWFEHSGEGQVLDCAVARLRASATNYQRTKLSTLIEEFSNTKKFKTPILNALFGAVETKIENLSAGMEDLRSTALDQSQMIAVENAVNTENAVTIIQGPPGTGKTHVLEQVIRFLVEKGKRILLTAPSNTAVDNACRRMMDLPLLRMGKEKFSIAPDVLEHCWVNEPDCIKAFKAKRNDTACVYCGTHLGILRDPLIEAELEKNGLFDLIVFDEAGMTRMTEFILCGNLANRAILFGDHQQLPPFPIPQFVMEKLRELGPILRRQWSCLTFSALQWLIEERGFSVFLLQTSYRCQNPRLMRFSSTLFYNARVKTSRNAEYFKLSYFDRTKKYPPSTLRFLRTSKLPLKMRQETFIMEGKRPGLENSLEANIAVKVFWELLQKYPLEQITIIAPYRRQIRLIRSKLESESVKDSVLHQSILETEWSRFLKNRISTVDRFQGCESDAVIICYVRSNEGKGIGFVDDPNRINVAHTRCRKEMVIIGDLECLKKQGKNTVFLRLERSVKRDGVLLDVTEDQFPIEGEEQKKSEEFVLMSSE